MCVLGGRSFGFRGDVLARDRVRKNQARWKALPVCDRSPPVFDPSELVVHVLEVKFDRV